jgi:hypothetical protein
MSKPTLEEKVTLSRAVAVVMMALGLLSISAVLVVGAFLVRMLAISAGTGEVQLALILAVGAGMGIIRLFIRVIMPLARSRWRNA